MDAITLLKDDHKTVEKLFKRFEKAGDGAYKEKRNVAERIREELSRHAAIEEQLFYPVVRGTVDGVEDVTLESLEEHHIVKWVLSELDDMDPKDERFTAKMTVLIENVRHHVEEEEDELFPKVRDQLGRKDLRELGDAMEAARRIAPTHPHPKAPDTPPGNIVLGAAAGAADRLGDGAKSAAQGAVSSAQDLVSRFLGNRSSGSSGSSRNGPSRNGATGSRNGRSASGTARTAAARGTKTVSSSTRKASSSAKKAAATTKRTAKATASGTRKAASGTAKKAGSTARKASGAAKKRTTAGASR